MSRTYYECKCEETFDDYDELSAHMAECDSFKKMAEGRIPVCLICGEPLEWLDLGGRSGECYDQVDEGGNVMLSFFFGSRHDSMMDVTGAAPIRGYIHDGCFDKVRSRTTAADAP